MNLVTEDRGDASRSIDTMVPSKTNMKQSFIGTKYKNRAHKTYVSPVNKNVNKTVNKTVKKTKNNFGIKTNLGDIRYSVGPTPSQYKRSALGQARAGRDTPYKNPQPSHNRPFGTAGSVVGGRGDRAHDGASGDYGTRATNKNYDNDTQRLGFKPKPNNNKTEPMITYKQGDQRDLLPVKIPAGGDPKTKKARGALTVNQVPSGLKNRRVNQGIRFKNTAKEIEARNKRNER